MSDCASVTVTIEQKSILVVEIPTKSEISIEMPDHVVVNNYETEGELDSVVESYEAAAAINVNRAMVLRPDGRIEHADKDDLSKFGDVIGVSRQSGAIGAFVDVVKFGKLTGASFGTVSENFFLGVNGQLLSTAPSTGIWQSIGIQSTATEFFVNIGEPIQL